MKIVEQYVFQLKTEKRRWWRMVVIITVLSLLVAAAVSWNLRLTGVTVANDATCGYTEHQHTEECPVEKTLICGYVVEETVVEESEELTDGTGPEESVEGSKEVAAEEIQPEHVHTEECYQVEYLCGYEEHIHEITCYSDTTADLETAEIWEATIPELTGVTAEDIVLVAKSQIGYQESADNFVMAEDGETKQGITRYGQWYGNPYGDWSAMFTSFCLKYAEVSDLPLDSGAETMRLAWEEKELYRQAGQYDAQPGDLIFLDKNGNGTADATAIIAQNDLTTLLVIEGDVENAVAETSYPANDPALMGYGITTPESNLVAMNALNEEDGILPAAAGATYIGKTTSYDQSLFTDTNSFVLYTQSGASFYAFDGNGNAVEVFVDEEGVITSDIADVNLLLWTFTPASGTNNYLIQNASTGRYMHAFPNNGSGVTTTGAYSSTLISANGGIKVRSNTEYATLNTSGGNFVMTQSQTSAATYQLGMISQCTVWLDGTNGGLMSLMGSDDKNYTVEAGGTVVLPTQWKSPGKYNYVLRGWYDVKNSTYYAPGTELTVNENLVFYADWEAATYDVGRYNSYVADTVSTSDFITAHIFDYNALFNVMSQQAEVTVTSAGHSEVWQQVTSGTVPYKGGQTLDFDFLDYDGNGDISYPNGRNSNNSSAGIYSGLYSGNLAKILFSTGNAFDPDTGTGIIGKKYVGTADHLFQKNTDPTDQYYGYYYYDSKLNAASYNQSAGRFYVYDYLERTADSEKDGGAGGYSDFLPFNSPYANTNGKAIKTYNYAGENGEYGNTVHYQYDAKYNTNNNSVNNIGTNYGFGMSMDIEFFLPNDPGTVDAYGDSGNRDVYGNEMCFYFSGDDDVWVLLDGKMVLDLGGVHGIESGNINFSTGVVTINGAQSGTLSGVTAGEHTLTVYYLERGSSQSNCSILFNLAPRFSLSIQKEDVLTQELLNGAQFSVYSDATCTIPCELWESEASHRRGDAPTNTFTIVDGAATMWGFSSSSTYYIKETQPPDQPNYSCARGIIRVTLNKSGVASYNVDIIPETDENGNETAVSNGFTVHGFRIDEENQAAYIVITNAQNWVEETTSVYVEKKWDDGESHASDNVTVYLNITDPDGTVRRIREIVLNEENGWSYTWVNLPKYYSDGETEVQYSVAEAYIKGYTPQIEQLESTTVTIESWPESYTFQNGGTYVLKTGNGCLSAVSDTAGTLCFVDEATAKTSPLAQWTATVSGSNLKLTNQNGQILSYNSSYYSGRRYFYVNKNTTGYQNLTWTNESSTTGIRLRYSSYYAGALNSSNYAAATSQTNALSFFPLEKQTTTTQVAYDGYAYRITNVTLEEETALTVTKKWQHPTGNQELYEQEQVTIRLYADGADTGRTVTLNLKNGWTGVFEGLPYRDSNGAVISYTVEETWETEHWIATYGEIIVVEGTIPTYETTVTNTYRWGDGVELPETGGSGLPLYILCGLVLALTPFIYGFRLRRKNKRRLKK